MSSDKISLPEYENPPVDEVYCSLAFQRLPGIKIHHVGLMWERFKEEFPVIEYAPLVGQPPEKFDPSEPLSRVWFVTESNDRLVQFQPDRFIFNWRRRPGGGQYPRYSSVYRDFEKSQQIFQEFLTENNLGEFSLQQYELSYINTIPKGAGWEETGRIGSVLPDLSWQDREDRFLPVPLRQNWQAVFRLPENRGELRAKAGFGVRHTDKSEILRLELTATGMNDDVSDAGRRDWFNLAHQWIVMGFADLTAETVQSEIWKRV